MKKIPLILTLLLTVAWGYTSWYWYTCNIKGFCDGVTPVIGESNLGQSQPEDDISEVSTENSSSTRLSASDVLLGSTANSSVTVEANTGAIETPSQSESLIKDSELVIPDTPLQEQKNICSGDFIGPVAVGGNNNTTQVELLEAFLISQGEAVTIDGSYDAADVDAVKRFQLKYKQDILDPWEISNPTGYVFTTTIKKMKEIGCK